MTIQTDELLVPLVGMHFRPPAKQVLAALPVGTLLSLETEPDNPYDEKAIRVLVWCQEQVQHEQYVKLADALQGTGTTLEDLLTAEDALHLGYIADSDGKQLGQSRLPGNREVGAMMRAGAVSAALAWGSDGKPQVRVWMKTESEAREEAGVDDDGELFDDDAEVMGLDDEAE